MNRGYTAADYLTLVEKLRKKIPDVALSTDIIVGFPGETENDFNDTADIMKEIEYDNAFIFKYSTRKGTAAENLPDQVPLYIKKERNQILLKLQEEISLKKYRSLIGTRCEVLVEGESKKNCSRLTGRTRQNKIAVFSKKSGLIGELVNVKVKDASAHTLFCEL